MATRRRLVRRPLLLPRLAVPDLLDDLVNVLGDVVDIGGDLAGDVPDVADGRSPRLPGLVERMAIAYAPPIRVMSASGPLMKW